jgi:hypothetical protein
MDAMAVVGVEFGVYLVVDTEGSVGLMVVPGYRVGIDVGVSAAVGGFIYAGADVSQISGRGVNIGVDLPVASGSWQMSCQNASCTDVKHGVGVSYGVGAQFGFYAGESYGLLISFVELFSPAFPLGPTDRYWLLYNKQRYQ